MVTVHYRDVLAEKANKQAEEMEAASIKEVLANIKQAYGAEAHKLAKKMVIVVNDVSTTLLQNYRTPLKPGDVVKFLPISGGG